MKLDLDETPSFKNYTFIYKPSKIKPKWYRYVLMDIYLFLYDFFRLWKFGIYHPYSVQWQLQKQAKKDKKETNIEKVNYGS